MSHPKAIDDILNEFSGIDTCLWILQENTKKIIDVFEFQET